MKIQIIRYANRKLYNTETAKYINLSDVLKYPSLVQVTQHDTREDITAWTIAMAKAYALKPKVR